MVVTCFVSLQWLIISSYISAKENGLDRSCAIFTTVYVTSNVKQLAVQSVQEIQICTAALVVLWVCAAALVVLHPFFHNRGLFHFRLPRTDTLFLDSAWQDFPKQIRFSKTVGCQEESEARVSFHHWRRWQTLTVTELVNRSQEKCACPVCYMMYIWNLCKVTFTPCQRLANVLWLALCDGLMQQGSMTLLMFGVQCTLTCSALRQWGVAVCWLAVHWSSEVFQCVDLQGMCHRYDFFVVSQHVRQGTVSPTHYIVVHDEIGLPPERMQVYTYKQTHLYYNWPGTVRVPAPCLVRITSSFVCLFECLYIYWFSVPRIKIFIVFEGVMQTGFENVF